MNTEHVHEFVLLARSCSFQETAAQAFISQSSLTKHIQSLEKELGVPLFDRTTRSVTLNAYGRAFLPYAQAIDRQALESRAALRSLLRDRSGRLNVAFQSRLGQYGVIRLLSDFQEEHPDIPLDMAENNQVARFLTSGECDFVFTAEPTPEGADLAEYICRSDNLAVALPASHPLAHSAHIAIEQLRGERMVVHEDTPLNASWETRTLRRLCAQAGFEPREVMTVSFTSNLVRMVEQGLGVGVINRMHAGNENTERVCFVDLFPAVTLHTRLLYPRRLESEPAAAAFLRFVRSRMP